MLYGFCAGLVAVISSPCVPHLATWQSARGRPRLSLEPLDFTGTELVKVLTVRGHRVFGLTRFREGAERVRRAGTTAVMGDLLEPGKWQGEVAADWVCAVCSNIRLRGIGFRFRHPTLEQGLQEVFGALHE